jgi:hypothetical protein
VGVACGSYGKLRNGCKRLIGKYDVKGRLEDLGVDRRILLKCMFRKVGRIV